MTSSWIAAGISARLGTTSPSLIAFATVTGNSGVGGVAGCHCFDAVGAEAGPVVGFVLVDDDDGGLGVAELLGDVGACGGVAGDVDDAVGEAGLVELAAGHGAANALGRGVDGEGVHPFSPFSWCAPPG